MSVEKLSINNLNIVDQIIILILLIAYVVQTYILKIESSIEMVCIFGIFIIVIIMGSEIIALKRKVNSISK